MKSTMTRTPLEGTIIKYAHYPESASGQAIPQFDTGQVVTNQRKL